MFFFELLQHKSKLSGGGVFIEWCLLFQPMSSRLYNWFLEVTLLLPHVGYKMRKLLTFSHCYSSCYYIISLWHSYSFFILVYSQKMQKGPEVLINFSSLFFECLSRAPYPQFKKLPFYSLVIYQKTPSSYPPKTHNISSFVRGNLKKPRKQSAPRLETLKIQMQFLLMCVLFLGNSRGSIQVTRESP